MTQSSCPQSIVPKPPMAIVSGMVRGGSLCMYMASELIAMCICVSVYGCSSHRMSDFKYSSMKHGLYIYSQLLLQ